MSTISPYSLNCSVCGGEYCSRSDWLQHLSSEGHQVLARSECLKEWDTKKVKKCCLVVFSSFPLTRTGGNGTEGGRDRVPVDAVIKYFSRNWTTIVTDFVWWEERARVGLVQFESRKKVKEVLSTLEDSADLLINNQRIQVKWAMDLLDLEFTALLPTELSEDVSIPLKEEDGSVLESSQVSVIPSQLQTTEAESNKTKNVISSSQEINNSEVIEKGINNEVTRKRSRWSLSTPEPDQLSKKFKALEKHELENGNRNAISLLYQYCQQHYWPPPKFIFTKKVLNSIPNFSCSVIVNGIEYKPDAKMSPAKTKQKSKLDIASMALTILKTSPSSAVITTQTTSPSSAVITTQTTSPSSAVITTQTTSPTAAVITTQTTSPAAAVITTEKSKDLEIAPVPVEVENIFQRDAAPDYEPDSIQYQLWSISKSIKIPDHEHLQSLEIFYNLRRLFFKSDPSAEVSLFRNRYLKLRNPSNEDNQLLIYAYYSQSPPEHPQSFSWIRDTKVWEVFHSKEAKKFNVIESLDDASRFDKTNPQYGWKILYKPLNLHFRLVFFKRFISEVQMCRMVEYLCKFDSRCHPLMTLAYHWCSVNHVRIGDTNPLRKNTHKSLLDPITLQWLVIFFLCHKKLIPSPRQLQERPHQILKERITEIDVGFNAHPAFARHWTASRKSAEESSEELVSSVLTLFQEFLQFWGDLDGEGNWIINTRDGELISTEKFVSKDPVKTTPDKDMSLSSWTTKLTAEEMQDLRLLQGIKPEDPNVPNKFGTYKVTFQHWKLYMIHPFVINWKFSICQDIHGVLKLMKQSAIQLKRYLNLVKNDGMEAAKKRCGTLENVLVIDKITRLKISTFFDDVSMESEKGK